MQREDRREALAVYEKLDALICKVMETADPETLAEAERNVLAEREDDN